MRVVAFTLGLALVGLMGWLYDGGTQEALDALGLVTETAENRLELRSLLSVLQDIETGQRGYALTGEQGFLEPHLEGLKAVPSQLESLRARLAGDPEASADLTRLEALVGLRLEQSRLIVRLRRDQGFAAAQTETASGRGQRAMDAVRSAIAEMDAKQVSQLETRNRLAQQHAEASRLQGRAGTTLSLVLLIAASVLVLRDNRRHLEYSRALQESEEGLSVTIHSIAEGVMATDAEGRVTRMNVHAERLTGCREHEAIGRPLPEVLRLIDEETRQPMDIPEIPTPVSGLDDPLGHTLLVARDGTERPISTNVGTIHGRDGETAGKVVAFRDQTSERRAAAEIDRFFQLSPDLLAIADFTGHFRRVSPSFQHTLGHEAETMLSRPFVDFVHPDDRAATLAELERLSTGAMTVHFDNRYGCVDGSYKTLSWLAMPYLRDGLIYCSGRDVTALRQSHDALRLANAQLDQASRHKDDFLANMSHELRTPLNAILGLSEALLEQTSGSLTARQHKSVATIRSSGAHLLDLINDILDLSKIEAGKLELTAERIQLREFCESCLVFVRTQAMHKRISVAFESDPGLTTFDADPRRLKQILVNLLTNAVKFTPDGGRVGLTVNTVDGEETPVVRFTVWDTGIGVAKADISRLFKSFTQVDSGLSREQEGTGLGLALVAKLAELQGGSVAVDSEPGKGSRFTVTLPQHAGAAATASAGAGPNRRDYRRALVVEDDVTAREILEGYLAELGLTTVAPARGEDAIAMAANERPDVIFLDVLLPGESGWVVLARLKEDPRTRDIPVVVASIVDEPRKSLSLGAAAHFTKPITRTQLAGFLQSSGPRQVSAPGFRRALLIEDDPTAAAILVDYLSDLGLSSVRLARGEESVAVTLGERPDVILLDILLPGDSGWVVLTRLKEHPGTRDIPVAVISVVDEPQKSYALGAAAHFTKPVTRDQLARFLQRPVSAPGTFRGPSTHSRGPVILLAEDNEANVQTIGGYLEDKGYQMHYAVNGLVAVKLAHELQPDVILMDIQMPVMDGLTAIGQVRADPQLAGIPIIALTALAMSGDRERCLAAGATDYLSKPVSLKALAALVASLVASHSPS